MGVTGRAGLDSGVEGVLELESLEEDWRGDMAWFVWA